MDDSRSSLKMGYELRYAPENVNPAKYSHDTMYKQMQTMNVLPPDVTAAMHTAQQPMVTPVPPNEIPSGATTMDKQPIGGSGFYHESRPVTALPPSLSDTWDNVIRPMNPAFHPVPSSLNSAFRQSMPM